jgi:hypothetical protein
VNAVARVLAAALLLAPAAGCGSSPAAPAPTPVSLTLTGTWNGTGSDPQGDERMTWRLAQTGSALSGTADLAPLNAADGSCGSCHKFKTGSLTGTLSGTTLMMKLVFPSGGDGVPTPMCTITFDATAPVVDGSRIAATYTGDDSCEGPFTGGTFVMTR